MRVRMMLSAAVLGVLGMGAFAAPLPVVNGSFENPAIPNAYPYVGTPAAGTWDMTGYFLGSFLNVTGIANADGNQLGYILSSGQFGESFSQTLAGHAFESGKHYTLSADVCISSNSPLPTDKISLALVYFDNAFVPHVVGNQLDIYNDLAAGLSTTSVKSFSLDTGPISDPAAIGKEIGIRIWTTGTAVPDIFTAPQNGLYFDVDNVQVAVVPEPATLGLVAMAAAAFVRPRRRR